MARMTSSWTLLWLVVLTQGHLRKTSTNPSDGEEQSSLDPWLSIDRGSTKSKELFINSVNSKDENRYYHRDSSGKCLVKKDEEGCPSRDEKGLTIGVLYCNDDVELEDTLKSWSRWSTASKDAIDFVVVDDGSDEKISASAIIARVAKIVPLPVVRILNIVDKIVWNIPGATNLLMHRALHCRVMMMDSDYILPEGLALDLVRVPARSGVIYKFKRTGG